jgi:hypothetical protein
MSAGPIIGSVRHPLVAVCRRVPGGIDRTYSAKQEKGVSCEGLEIIAKLGTRSWGRAVQ